jgi:hypothetical protein
MHVAKIEILGIGRTAVPVLPPDWNPSRVWIVGVRGVPLFLQEATMKGFRYWNHVSQSTKTRMRN